MSCHNCDAKWEVLDAFISLVRLTASTVTRYRAPDNVPMYNSIMPISSPNPMFDHWLESSHGDDSNKWLNIGISEEITHVVMIEVNLTLYPGLWLYTTLWLVKDYNTTNTICQLVSYYLDVGPI